MLKSMRKFKNRYFYHIFVSPGDAPGAITSNVVWMEDNSMLTMLTNCLAACTHLSSSVSQLFEPGVQKIAVLKPTFLFLLETPLRLSRNVLHGWKDNSMPAKGLTACTYLSSTVSELYDP